MRRAVSKLQRELKLKGNSAKAEWLQNYVKHNTKSRGVGIPDIRKVVKIITSEFTISEKSLALQSTFINELMSGSYTEEKLSAIIFMQLYWEEIDADFQLRLISDWFENDLIFDWNVCDWLCVRTLSQLIDKHPDKCISELSDWNKSKNLWKARASLVAFAACKSLEKHKNTVKKFSIKLIKREERFSKTAVGWLLRVCSKIDSQFTLNFIEAYIQYFTKETVDNSLKYYGKDIKKSYLEKMKTKKPNRII